MNNSESLAKQEALHPVAHLLSNSQIALTKIDLQYVNTVLEHWGMKPQTLAKRIDKALPNAVSKALYVKMALHYRIHPETLATLIAIFQGKSEFRVSEFQDCWLDNKGTLRYRASQGFEEYITAALELINKCTLDRHLKISAETAGILAKHSGFGTQDLIEDIFSNIGLINRILDLDIEDEFKLTSITLRLLATAIEEGEFVDTVNIYDYVTSTRFFQIKATIFDKDFDYFEFISKEREGYE